MSQIYDSSLFSRCNPRLNYMYLLFKLFVNFLGCSSKYFLAMSISYSKILGPPLCGYKASIDDKAGAKCMVRTCHDTRNEIRQGTDLLGSHMEMESQQRIACMESNAETPIINKTKLYRSMHHLMIPKETYIIYIGAA